MPLMKNFNSFGENRHFLTVPTSLFKNQNIAPPQSCHDLDADTLIIE